MSQTIRHGDDYMRLVKMAYSAATELASFSENFVDLVNHVSIKMRLLYTLEFNLITLDILKSVTVIP